MFLHQIITESKQSIINLGFPEVIASLMKEKFGNNAFILSNWFKDYHSYGRNNWWKTSMQKFSISNLDLYDLCLLYTAGKISNEEYKKVAIHLDLNDSVDDMKDHLQSLRKQISEFFFKDIFFSREIIEDFIKGKIKNIKSYEKLSFREANEKYSKKRIFDTKQSIIKYPNGYRWIDVGNKCTIIADKMSNCGSAGVMSSDPDRTILSLFDNHNNPHVIATYSPNEKRISGVEGKSSSSLKDEYANYVIDLVKKLNVTYDAEKSKSKLLSIKFKSNNKATNIEKIKSDNGFFDNYQFNYNGQIYYTNGEVAISKDDLEFFIDKLQDEPLLKGGIDRKVGILFSRYGEIDLHNIKPGFKFIHLNKL